MSGPAGQTLTTFWEGYTPTGPGLAPSLAATPACVDVLAVAFTNLFPGNVVCREYMQKAHSEDQIRADIASLRASAPDMKILMSLIGTPDPAVGWNTGITDPTAFARYLSTWLSSWGLDGFDIDNEDLDTWPGDPFVAAVKEMRQVMPDAILTLDTYLFDRDKTVIPQLADDLTGINTMAYFDDLETMQALVEQYAGIIDPGKISIGVKSAPLADQGTSLADTIALTKWNPSGGAKRGMMLWNQTLDIKGVTGQPDGTWTRAIADNLS